MLQPEHVSSSKLTVHAISRFFAPMFLRPFGHSISDEATANSATAMLRSATKKKGVKGAGRSDTAGEREKAAQTTGESDTVIQSFLGTGSREVFQSISLRAYDKPTVKRISYAEKRKAMAHSAAVDSVDALMEWERQTGCFTEDDE